MTDFEVDPAALRAAADAAQQAADVVRTLDLGRVTELATALPGTESAGTAGQLGPHWEDSCASWAEGMNSYAANLNSAADDYQERDDANAHGFGQTVGG
ncbi:uncharacterized protein YukE [Actinoalloteichus hoggarensis]|uniref:Uncharacterized protein n=1 Tax=Actinoalloteichus hoggarensis TaxID=1470176 RepID=A0A221W588_9PSEU|nr:type VII secretion target [Actinoalloteichus hoggarensis]ASO21080.1 hypothetical protein AHOG_17275 [Actinoalloteichus hoggarensis]MBB5921010.1 uncharacterized protein YukE [Actinoalloteichus hoggarensis]